MANGIRKVANELFSWANLSPPMHTKDTYEYMPLGIAIIAIIFSLGVFVGFILSMYSLFVN